MPKDQLFYAFTSTNSVASGALRQPASHELFHHRHKQPPPSTPAQSELSPVKEERPVSVPETPERTPPPPIDTSLELDSPKLQQEKEQPPQSRYMERLSSPSPSLIVGIPVHIPTLTTTSTPRDASPPSTRKCRVCIQHSPAPYENSEVTANVCSPTNMARRSLYSLHKHYHGKEQWQDVGYRAKYSRRTSTPTPLFVQSSLSSSPESPEKSGSNWSSPRGSTPRAVLARMQADRRSTAASSSSSPKQKVSGVVSKRASVVVWNETMMNLKARASSGSMSSPQQKARQLEKREPAVFGV